jgi:hypothetical protein
MAYIGRELQDADAVVDTKTWNNSDTTLTLSVDPGSVNNVAYFEDGVRQVPTTDYTVSGLTLTRTSTPANGVIGMAVSGSTLTIGSPADSTVTKAKVSSGNFVTDFTDTTITASDEILFADSSDSGNEKKDTIQGILDLVPVSSSSRTVATKITTTSGTTADWTGIPSGVTEIHITLDGVNTNIGDAFLIQIGDSGGVETSGYSSSAIRIDENGFLSGLDSADSTAGFIIDRTNRGAVGLVILSKITGNEWACSHTTRNVSGADVELSWGAGEKSALTSELDRVTITTITGTPTFNAGQANISYI